MGIQSTLRHVIGSVQIMSYFCRLVMGVWFFIGYFGLRNKVTWFVLELIY